MNETCINLCHSVSQQCGHSDSSTTYTCHDTMVILSCRAIVPRSSCLAAAGTESPDFQYGLQATTVSSRGSTRINEDQRGSWNLIGTYRYWVHNVHIMFIWCSCMWWFPHMNMPRICICNQVGNSSNQKYVPSPARTSHKSSGRPPGRNGLANAGKWQPHVPIRLDSHNVIRINIIVIITIIITSIISYNKI